MRSAFWVLLLAVSSQVSAQMMPILKDPVDLGLPNCPFQLMGTANDIYYYGTQNCQSGGSGYGQTTNPNVRIGCNGSECWDPISPLRAFGKEGSLMLPGCDPATTTLQQAKDACQARLNYLDKLLASLELDNRNKGRIRGWRGRAQAMLNYLNNGGQPEADRITNYCTVFVPQDTKHDKYWSHAVLGHIRKTQIIGDERQPNLPVKGTVHFDPKGSGATPVTGPVLKVQVNDLQGGDKTVYFQTIVVNDGQDHFRIGLEVDPTGVTEDGAAEFVDRHRHGHLIKATSGPTTGVWYLVSSFTNLEIKN